MVMCCLANSYYSMQKNNFFYKHFYCRANKNYGDYRFVTIKID